jgi:hypothetical protein
MGYTVFSRTKFMKLTYKFVVVLDGLLIMIILMIIMTDYNDGDL